MKNKLIATMLTFATITSITGQSTKTELMTHLKNVKTEIELQRKESKKMLPDSPEAFLH